jgi:hypothetical protein
MAVITPNTFDPLKRYVGVRLQQGVPLVDADENEREDALRFAIRALARAFIGDGVPTGNNGFELAAVSPAPQQNDFIIRSGRNTASPANGLSNIGRCLVDGMDVLIADDLRFTQQPLHTSQAGAAALAAAWGVPVIAMPALANATVAVYLDVWERLVLPTEDPALVLPGLGTESCARLRREWAVRVRSGTVAPLPGQPDFIAGHGYLLLATLVRRSVDNGLVNPADLTDRRATGLNLGGVVTRLQTVERLLLLPAFDPPPNEMDVNSGTANTLVKLGGRNFNLGAVSVRFGGTLATITSISATQLSVRVPAMAPGVVRITVQTEGGSVTSTGTFQVQ